MKPRIVFLPPAVADLQMAAHWLDGIRPGLSSELETEVNEFCCRIGNNPEMYERHNPGWRRTVLHRFDYALVYRIHDDTIEVVALFHCRLNPAVLTRRTGESH